MIIDRLMHQFQNDGTDPQRGGGKMMKGKKMSGAMKCCMMDKKSSGKEPTVGLDTSAAAGPEYNTEPPKDEHEGHQ